VYILHHIRPHRCLVLLLLCPCVSHFIAVLSNYHYISVHPVHAYYMAVLCLFLITLQFSSQEAHYVAVLFLSASLDCSPLHEWFIIYLLSICLITLEFSVCVPHSIVFVSIYASLYCSPLHMCFITLYFSPYVPYDNAFLAIYTSSHCASVHVCLITAFFSVYVPHYMLFSPYIPMCIADHFICSLVHCCSDYVCLITLLFSMHMLHYIQFYPYVMHFCILCMCLLTCSYPDMFLLLQTNPGTFTYVTCAVFNYNGTEILGSYNDEDIYLFDTSHPDGSDFIHRFEGHRNNDTGKVAPVHAMNACRGVDV